MSRKLEYTSEVRDGGTRIYRLGGNLYGSAEAYGFQDEVRKLVASGTRRFVVDLSSVEHIDSSGVGILVSIMWSASQGGAGLVLACLPPKVEKVLGIAMLLDHISHAASVDEAMARLDTI